jgi:hypothetical protein
MTFVSLATSGWQPHVCFPRQWILPKSTGISITTLFSSHWHLTKFALTFVFLLILKQSRLSLACTLNSSSLYPLPNSKSPLHLQILPSIEPSFAILKSVSVRELRRIESIKGKWMNRYICKNPVIYYISCVTYYLYISTYRKRSRLN